MINRKSVALLALVGLISVTLACGGGNDDTSEASNSNLETVSGLVIEVQSKSILELDTISLLTESGDTMVFDARGKRFSGFDPSHLRAHVGTRLSISFHREDGALVIDSITD